MTSPQFTRRSVFGSTAAGITSDGKAVPAWSPQCAVSSMNKFGIAAQVVLISEPCVAYLPTAAEREAVASAIFTTPGDPAPQLERSFDRPELQQALRGNALRQLPKLKARIAA